MRLQEENLQTNPNMRKVVQIERFLAVVSLPKSSASGGQWHTPCDYAYCDSELQCKEA